MAKRVAAEEELRRVTRKRRMEGNDRRPDDVIDSPLYDPYGPETFFAFRKHAI